MSSSQKYSEGRGAEGVRQLDRKTDPDRWDRGKEPPSNFAAAVCLVVFFFFFFFFSPLNLITRTDPPALQTKKMPKSSPCVFPWSSLWLASLATLVVQSVLSSSYSSSSSSTYQRPAAGGKRPGFMERTLILLDVNTRSPIRVLNDNFLSLQLDPSIIKDGWLDFLRYQRVFLLNNNIDLYRRPPPKCLVVPLFITHAATLSELSWSEPARSLLTQGTEWSNAPRNWMIFTESGRVQT